MTGKEIQSLELVERNKWRLATREIATKRREEVLIYIYTIKLFKTSVEKRGPLASN